MDKPWILHLSQDDPKKCSARKMGRFQKAKLVHRMKRLPNRAIVLDPFSKKALSPADRKIAEKRGVVAVDCSWADATNVFDKLNRNLNLESRALPMLMASNPVKFGKWGELSTLEALSAAYFILGEREMAEDMLRIYNWGIRFMQINIEPLEAYAKCGSSSEVVRIQKEFIE